MTSSQSPLDLSASLPNIKFNITSTPVVAKSRKLKMTWSQTAADDLRRLWGPIWPRRPDNVLDVLKDALEDPDYDPDAEEDYKGRWRWEDGRVATPEEVKKAHSGSEVDLVATMADEMRAEVDREIMESLKNLP
jgi:hypothetical protein